MKHLGVFVGVVVMGLLVGCGPVGPEEQGGEEPGGSADGAVRYTPEQVQEMLSKVPELDDGMLQAFAAACNPTSTNSCVNAGYGSCGSWSAYANCGTLSSTCNFAGCKRRVCDPEFGCYFEPTGSQSQGRNRYRVCFNAGGQSCTEYEYTTTYVCGCANNL